MNPNVESQVSNSNHVKVMGATPSSPEDIAKALLLQSALARKGVSPKAIADAINKLTRCATALIRIWNVARKYFPQ